MAHQEETSRNNSSERSNEAGKCPVLPGSSLFARHCRQRLTYLDLVTSQSLHEIGAVIRPGLTDVESEALSN